MQTIKNFLQLTDGYELHPDVSGDNAFLLRGVKAYYHQEGLPTCDGINRMVFLLNPQYPGGFVPKGKTNILSHIQSAFLCFGLVMDGTGLDGFRDGKCLYFVCAFWRNLIDFRYHFGAHWISKRVPKSTIFEKTKH